MINETILKQAKVGNKTITVSRVSSTFDGVESEAVFHISGVNSTYRSLCYFEGEALNYFDKVVEMEEAELKAATLADSVNTIKSDCKVNAAERAVRAVAAAIDAERAGYDYRSVIIAAQNVVPELKDMNQIVQCVGTRGSNLHALQVLQTQFVKELEELTKPVNQEGPKVIYVLKYAVKGSAELLRIKCFETLEGAHRWWHINRHSILKGKILKETLN